ncbi:hypothetical protein N473_20745 [Pseudoalteromonas luteoviolacea CPMOR-1]|uniref:Uncharacterized protein n=1 Tax=Pseudoalteromonas luteoviolacea CPMOR-1 TaxID=1365248 RepID=A0A167K1B8_9GAMM|nr:hypothetical protein [Pseudoalteromonas luteoviolacea]KZN61974.1 hypothetical protein N473_20745 [Pseudoalteromonas luteoviolacea CPMOR-1]
MNVDQLLKDTGDFLCSEFSTHAIGVAEGIHEALTASKESISELVIARTNGVISEDDFAYELQREAKVFEAELLTLQVIAKATVVKMCDAAIRFILKSVNPIS